MPPKSPFPSSSELTAPGHGEVILAVLPPNNPTIAKQSFRYPLKLISRIPRCTLDSKYPSSATPPLHLYLLTYGGGLLPGDHIDVSITLQPRSRLVLTTPQGSTRIYKADRPQGQSSSPGKSRQTLNIKLGNRTGLCYLPDPSVPYERSRYEQVQRFTLLQRDQAADQPGRGGKDDHDALPPSLCVLDWVTQGRRARGENWSFHEWMGRNEVWTQDCKTGKRKLLLRDTVILDDGNIPSSDGDGRLGNDHSSQQSGHLAPWALPIEARAHPHGILGTLILHGPLFESLAAFFMQEFASQPRIGGRNWTSSDLSDQGSDNKETGNDVVWTAARIRRNFVLVKFGAREFESARDWLGGMVRREGSMEKEFGIEGLGCL